MIKAKKKFGQNFLQDESIKNKIIESIPNDVKRIVEIGPGLGDLTQKLVKTNSQIDCFEIDGELYEILVDKFQDEISSKKLSISNCDALNAWDKISSSEYFLVANLPYYVATNMILKAIDDPNCKGLVVMIQKEVAIKFSAKDRDKEFSSLAILAALKGKCELLFDVPSTAFNPPPKVVSSVIRLVKDMDLSLDLDYAEFKNFLKAAFSAPRKTLLKNLSSLQSKEMLENLFAKFELNPTIRPHELSVALYLKIFKEATNERREQRKISCGKISCK
ncbi:16S rRNA (adenine1518-N6/adenine1519-N6)-dimethyltransferase [Campylobacter iguaniorum]|uniref:16S rRNA (adenine(1518)-N(6)/adenine(1519)-N(6))- dimethyltransferase RsmA n=1 Tax=Campylobacter iguaniorum TaxID=1244531 RepID=UPI00073A34BB|nr:16S rRNA (adenine(1518)-N(6)/adenine(1519)-N(6))-dimethyltransferase RsmA [Campylobacter iguaniorum]ALV25430.1 16S rRNA (adenine1518-N6/adenine1519-N6)-dimethyltransferase [Campylobacter iguaniorum]